MLRLPDSALDPGIAAELRKYQDDVDAESCYEDRVARAKRDFKNKNKKKNKVFKNVRATLTDMCHGARRCCYCEDSVGDEVEHIRPKDLYPEQVFVWLNYLYVCGPCNGPKNNGFAVIDFEIDALIDVTRGRKDPVVPPHPGDPALIDPRTEDPMLFLELDLLDTFLFVPADSLSEREAIRAEYTLELLRLNVREELVNARRNAFGGYRARLYEYVDRKRDGTTVDDLAPLVVDLKETPHPTVWKEMKRQSTWIPDLEELFAAAPEALDW